MQVRRESKGKRTRGMAAGHPPALPLTAGDSGGCRKGLGWGAAPEKALPWFLGTEWGWSGEFFGIKKWRLLSAEGAWLAPGLCLAFVLTPRPRAAQEFSPFLRPMFDLNRQCGSSEEGGRMMAGVYGEVSAECARDSLGMNVALCVCA